MSLSSWAKRSTGAPSPSFTRDVSTSKFERHFGTKRDSLDCWPADTRDVPPQNLRDISGQNGTRWTVGLPTRGTCRLEIERHFRAKLNTLGCWPAEFGVGQHGLSRAIESMVVRMFSQVKSGKLSPAWGRNQLPMDAEADSQTGEEMGQILDLSNFDTLISIDSI